MRLTCLVAVVATALSGAAAFAQSDTAFQYQGALDQGGAPYTGTADFRFTLWDAAAGGNQIGAIVQVANVQIDEGLFDVSLDFGASALAQPRWLEIQLRAPAWDGIGTEPSFVLLSPREPVSAVPFSVTTRGIVVDDAGLVGVNTDEPASRLHVRATGAEVSVFSGNLQPLTSPAWFQTNTFAPGTHALFAEQGNTVFSVGAGGETFVGARLGVGQPDPAAKLHVVGNAFFNGGRVGIRTTTPQAELHVRGNTILGGAGARIDLGDSDDDIITANARINAEEGITYPDGLAQLRAFRPFQRRFSFNLAALNPNAGLQSNITVNGARAGDAVIVNFEGDIPLGLVIANAYVISNNTVRVTFMNLGPNTINPPATTLNVLVF